MLKELIEKNPFSNVLSESTVTDVQNRVNTFKNGTLSIANILMPILLRKSCEIVRLCSLEIWPFDSIYANRFPNPHLINDISLILRKLSPNFTNNYPFILDWMI